MDYPGLNDLIKQAIAEDVGHGDITTYNLIAADQKGRGIFYAKSPGILAGVNVSQAVFSYLEPGIEFEVRKNDGQEVVPGDIIAEVRGSTRALLIGERTALNFMQRLSGIATKTHRMVELVKYTKAQILDTRKTVPGLRALDKYAVRVGGGRNHRFGLYDGVMIKDNHIRAGGGILKAVAAVRDKVPFTVKIEVEVETFEQLWEALESKADIIMLDNMDIYEMTEAVKIIDGQALVEASGGINESNVAEVARTGVDFISMGSLTHSVSGLDISFDITETD
jgi:nicotinate-nucleotide pyrophosphorylase (carboxylating)